MKELPTDTPSITFPRCYDDIFTVDVTMNLKRVGPREKDFEADLERWYFRVN